MKKIISLILALVMLSVPVSANGLLIAPNPMAGGGQSETDELLENLVQGLVPITPDLTYEDFMIYLRIIDESDNKILSAKFETFVYVISLYFYGNLSEEEVFARFAEVTDKVDINNMDEHYATLFSMLDKFSYYLTPDKTESFFKPTSSKGIGIKMTWLDATADKAAGIYVDEVAVGSTAEEAGIAVGDRIVEFNGNDVRGLGFNALTAYSLSVPADLETLTLTLERDGEEKTYELARRENIFSEYRSTLYPQKDLIVIDIDSFMYQETADGIAKDLDLAYAEGYKDVIIDLRGNGGGDVYIAADIISKFLPTSEILFYMGRDGKYNAFPFVSQGNGYTFDSIQVLIDSGTASSAEITADTLQKLCGARIIGEKSFGKGVAQSVFTFEDGAAVGITTYVAYDRNGKTYNEVGLIPDYIIYPTIEKNTVPDRMPCFTSQNYFFAAEGEKNETVRGLEIRLSLLGYLSEEQVDQEWNSATENAIRAFQTANSFEATGALNDETYFKIMEEVDIYEDQYHITYTSFDYALRFS